jgi:hypothetical protein
MRYTTTYKMISILTHAYSHTSRIRNREHAKNTRQRKKFQIDVMISRIEELQAEVCTYALYILRYMKFESRLTYVLNRAQN